MGSNAAVPWFRETELFTSGAEGYHTFRIPGLVVAGDGTILAFTEGRRDGHHDYHALYMLLKRSTDNGATWGPLQVLDGDGTRTHHNPTPVYDSDTGLVWLAYNIDADRFMVMSSADSGATWSEPTDVSDQVRRPGMTFYVAGPGHGIQRRDGTLVIPCDHHMGMRMDSIYSKSHVVMSTDHGKTWQLGGSLSGSTDECEVVETQDGSLYMAVRGQRNRGDNRYCAWSRDGGLTWSDVEIAYRDPRPALPGEHQPGSPQRRATARTGSSSPTSPARRETTSPSGPATTSARPGRRLRSYTRARPLTLSWPSPPTCRSCACTSGASTAPTKASGWRSSTWSG